MSGIKTHTSAMDPKYANLPGIAADQPDVFETGDLTEVDQHQLELDEDHISDCVEVLHLSASDAMGKFIGKQLDASNIDFSDRIKSKKIKKTGYISWSGDLEMINKEAPENETIEQKLERLKYEVGEVVEEISKANTKDGRDNEKNGKLSVALSRVNLLQDELSSLKLEESMGAETIKNLSDPMGKTNVQLMTHLQQLKDTKTTQKDGGKTEETSMMTYQLMMKPETAKMEHEEKLAHLDKRLQALESALGARPNAMSTLSLETNQKSVFGAISVLSGRTALFEPNHLDHIEGRLAALQQKMNVIAEEKKKILQDEDKHHKIAELYEIMQKTNGLSTALPGIVDRLEALQGLHEQALKFSKTLTQMENVQEKLSTQLEGNSSLVRDIKKQFALNVENIQQNMKSIEDRMDKLK